MGRPALSLLIIVFVGILGATIGGADGSSEVPCYFIFGDSLFDNGNNNNLQTPSKVNFLPYGVDFPAGPTGRYADGRNTADIVGELLGFDNFIPSFASKPNGSELLVGVNYASGGAGILVETGKQVGDNVDMSKQLRNHGTTVSNIVEILGSRKSAHRHLAKCFYISSMVNNDYLNYYLLPQFSSIREKYNPEQFATLLIANYSNQIKRMYNLGARKVGLAGVLPVGCSPNAVAAANISVCDDSLNELVEPFNVRLRLLVDRFNVEFPDAKFVYLDSTLATNLALQGLDVKTVSCCEVSSVTGACIPNSVPCTNRGSYVFWDAFHPTEATNRIVASVYYRAIKQIL